MVARAAAKALQATATIAVATRFIRANKFDRRGPDPGGRQERRIRLCIRLYDHFGKGAKELFNQADVEKTMRSVKGLVSYTLVRSEGGGFSVTVCNDKAGTNESLEKARDWIATNAAGTGVAPPTISEGPNILDLKNGP